MFFSHLSCMPVVCVTHNRVQWMLANIQSVIKKLLPYGVPFVSKIYID